MVSKEEVIVGVQQLVDAMTKIGADIDITNLDIDSLTNDINEEYKCGADGSAFDIIMDLNDTVGLDEYSIIIS